MVEKNWFLHQNDVQIGPFSMVHIVQFVKAKMLTEKAHLFKIGDLQWRPLEGCMYDLGLSQDKKLSQNSDRRANAQRACASGTVLVQNSGQSFVGSGVNISSTGVFIETDARVFTIGETIQLSVQIDGMIKPFEATASVVRFSLKLGQKSGYGLKFQDLDPEIVAEIEWFVGVFTNQIRNVA